MNLIQNAAQHGAQRITVRATGSGFEVEDDGPGIPPAERERIFEPFYRLQPFTTGSGLGLNLVQEVITRHNGRVTILDAPRGRRDCQGRTECRTRLGRRVRREQRRRGGFVAVRSAAAGLGPEGERIRPLSSDHASREAGAIALARAARTAAGIVVIDGDIRDGSDHGRSAIRDRVPPARDPRGGIRAGTDRGRNVAPAHDRR